MSDEPKPHEYPLVLVEWHDSYGVGSGWRQITELDPDPLRCRSVGYIVEETDECVVVVPHLALPEDGMTRPDGSEARPDGCGDMTIPRRAVTRITNLDEAEK